MAKSPREAGLVACKFCNTPFVRDVQTEAVQCQQCGTYSDIRATNCIKCKAWVVVTLLFFYPRPLWDRARDAINGKVNVAAPATTTTENTPSPDRPL